MIAREKVIKGLYAHGYKDCKSCPYWGTGNNGMSDCRQLAREAYALLKEQEAVEPIKMQRMDNNFSFLVPYFLCGNCRYELVGKDVMFCSHCGRSVKWE